MFSLPLLPSFLKFLFSRQSFIRQPSADRYKKAREKIFDGEGRGGGGVIGGIPTVPGRIKIKDSDGQVLKNEKTSNIPSIRKISCLSKICVTLRANLNYGIFALKRWPFIKKYRLLGPINYK